jgi:hypothetical protein
MLEIRDPGNGELGALISRIKMMNEERWRGEIQCEARF